MKTPLVSVIIVNWNGGKVFSDCLNSLSKISYKNYELIIVDNGSTDGSDNVGKKYRVNKFIKNKSNVGFAEANNQGIKVSRGKYLLLLNNDTLVTKDFLNIMILKMEEDKSVGVMQPKIFMIDKPGHLDNAGSFLTWSGFLFHNGYGEKDSKEFDKERKVHTAKGACMLIRAEVVEKLGLFDPDFVSYFEESDFCSRVWLAGFSVLYYPKARIYHKVGFTSKKLDQFSVNYHSLKNRIVSYLKNFGSLGLIIIFIPHIAILFFLILIYLIKLDFGKVGMVLKAFWWNLLNLGKTIAKRKRIQKLRRVSDSQIFKDTLVGWKISDMIKHFFIVEKNF